MTTRNHRIRFGNNNWLEGMDYTTFTPSTSVTGLTSAVTELQKAEKSLAWTPTGRFIITSSNSRIYLASGGAVFIDIDTGTYLTPQALCTEIETKLSAATPGGTWTCTYINNAFQIDVDNPYQLGLDTSTNSIWDTIGFTRTTPETGISFSADSPRIHTSETFDIDLGTALPVSLVSLLGVHSDGLRFSDTAQVTVYLNNINDFTSPAETLTIDVHESGSYLFLDTLSSTEYRYVRIEIIDRENIYGNEGLNLSYLYVGDYLTLESRNFSRGFNLAHVINTKREKSEGGQLFHNRRPSHVELSNIGLRFLDGTDVKEIRQFIIDVDIDTPFIISLDPTLMCTDELQDLTYLVVMDGQSTPLNHIKNRYYSLVMKFREII